MHRFESGRRLDNFLFRTGGILSYYREDISKDILIFSTIQGHSSIATALSESFEKAGMSCKIYCYPDPSLRFYRTFYRNNPSLLRYYYKAVRISFLKYCIKGYLFFSYTKKVFQLINTYSPKILISTNYAFDGSIGFYRKQSPLPYFNVVTDPRTFFPTNLSTAADENFIFDQYIEHRCHELNSRAKTKVIGWLIRDIFEVQHDKKKVRRHLNLEENVLTFLFVTGWEGTAKVLDILPALKKTKNRVQVIVACGSNKNLLKKVERVSQSLNVSHDKLTVIGLPFTQDIYLYMQASDLVIGKAGPNMLFEAVATRTPFFAITHLHGQEDGNLDIIREYNVGYVEENPHKAQNLLTGILNHPDQLDKFRPHLERMATINNASKNEVVQIMRKYLGK